MLCQLYPLSTFNPLLVPTELNIGHLIKRLIISIEDFFVIIRVRNHTGIGGRTYSTFVQLRLEKAEHLYKGVFTCFGCENESGKGYHDCISKSCKKMHFFKNLL